MACVSLEPIFRQCGANPGGTGIKVYICRVADITTIPAATAGVISTDITMVATKAFAQWDIELDSGDVKIETVGSVSNPCYNVSATFKMARNSAAIDTKVAAAIGQELVALIPKNSGEMQLIGSLERGAFLGLKQADGLKAADFAGKDLTLTWEGQTHLPYYYTGDIPLS